MSQSSYGDRFMMDIRTPAGRQRFEAMLLRGLRIGVWGVVSFVLHLAEQIAELLAPLLFTLGLLWWAVLKAVHQMHFEESVQRVVEQVPASLWLDQTWLTPGKLMWDGVMLMAVVAACRTVNGIIAKET